MNTFDILGIQPKEVRGLVNDVARVRMRVGSEVVDEDFTLPTLPTGVPPYESVYGWFLTEDINNRMTEIGNGLIDTTKSEVPLVEKEQVEQIVSQI